MLDVGCLVVACHLRDSTNRVTCAPYRHRMAEAVPHRRLELEGVHNFRDIGGYDTQSGGRVARGRVFRADGLNRLTSRDVERVRGLGLQTVIDLRSTHEVESHGTFPVDQHPVDFHHIPTGDVTRKRPDLPDVADDADVLRYSYQRMLELSVDQLRTAFTLVAQRSTEPLVYHCTAGKDRTGVLTMLVLGCLGVSQHDIASDYALTAETLEESRAVLKMMYPEIAQVGNEWGHQYMMASYDTMDRLVSDVLAQHGSITNATRSLGVTTEAIELLQRNLIE